jgi:hypothetical protein
MATLMPRMRRRFVAEMPVTPAFLRDADHARLDIWVLAAPYDAVKGSVIIEKLSIPTNAVQHRHRDAITVRVFGSAEQAADPHVDSNTGNPSTRVP